MKWRDFGVGVVGGLTVGYSAGRYLHKKNGMRSFVYTESEGPSDSMGNFDKTAQVSVQDVFDIEVSSLMSILDSDSAERLDDIIGALSDIIDEAPIEVAEQISRSITMLISAGNSKRGISKAVKISIADEAISRASGEIAQVIKGFSNDKVRMAGMSMLNEFISLTSDGGKLVVNA